MADSMTRPQLPASASHLIQPRKMSFPKSIVRVEDESKGTNKILHTLCVVEEHICIMAIVHVLKSSHCCLWKVCLYYLFNIPKPFKMSLLFSHDIANKQMCVFTDPFLIPAHQPGFPPVFLKRKDSFCWKRDKLIWLMSE